MNTQSYLQISANLAAVNQRVETAAQRAGRDPAEIRLLPVTKFVPEERLRELARLGYLEMGENRVQEMQRKAEHLADLDVSWILIGKLQRNKARVTAQVATEIHSLDSLRLANTLNRHLEALDRTMPVLLQVNTSGEETKSGFSPAEALAAYEEIRALPHLDIRGLMTMARPSEDSEVVRASFTQLRELRDRLSPTDLPELSMGMSGDMEIAIEEGATIIRVGSAIFGARPTT